MRSLSLSFGSGINPMVNRSRGTTFGNAMANRLLKNGASESPRNVEAALQSIRSVLQIIPSGDNGLVSGEDALKQLLRKCKNPSHRIQDPNIVAMLKDAGLLHANGNVLDPVKNTALSALELHGSSLRLVDDPYQ